MTNCRYINDNDLFKLIIIQSAILTRTDRWIKKKRKYKKTLIIYFIYRKETDKKKKSTRIVSEDRLKEKDWIGQTNDCTKMNNYFKINVGFDLYIIYNEDWKWEIDRREL